MEDIVLVTVKKGMQTTGGGSSTNYDPPLARPCFAGPRFTVTILAARKLHELGDKPCPAREYAISDAITKAEALLERD